MSVDRIAEAYRGERLGIPLGEIEDRARRRPRRWAVAAAVTATAAIAVITAATSSGIPRAKNEVGSGNPCAEMLTQLNVGVPEERMAVRSGDEWVRVFVGGGVITTCRGKGNLGTQTYSTTMDTPLGTLSLFGGVDATLKNQGVLVGRVPPRTAIVELRTATDQVELGVIRGEIFAIFAPGLSTVDGRVVAKGLGGFFSGEVAVPSEASMVFDPVRFGPMCADRGVEVLRDRGLAPTMPPLVFKPIDSPEEVVWLYLTDRATLACAWRRGDGFGMTGFTMLADPPPDAFTETVVSLGDAGGWVVGVAYADATKVELELAAGQRFTAELSGRQFMIRWTGAGAVKRLIVHRTGNRIESREDPFKSTD